MTTVSDLFCPECGYNLHGIDSRRCPECGHEIDWARVSRSRIPWVHRGELGRWRAYWRTVWLVCIESRLVSDDVLRPVSFEDARRFRNVTVWLAFVPLALAEIVAYVALLRDRGHFPDFPSGTRLGWALEFGCVPVALLGLFLFLKAATAVPSWFFHPHEMPVVRQNRAVALSYYGGAPLAWTPLTAISIGLFLGLRNNMNLLAGLTDLISLILLAGLVLLQTVGWWLGLIRLMRRTTQCGAGRIASMSLGLPLIWMVLFAAIALGIPAAYLFVSLVILSVR